MIPNVVFDNGQAVKEILAGVDYDTGAVIDGNQVALKRFTGTTADDADTDELAASGIRAILSVEGTVASTTQGLWYLSTTDGDLVLNRPADDLREEPYDLIVTYTRA